MSWFASPVSYARSSDETQQLNGVLFSVRNAVLTMLRLTAGSWPDGEASA